MNNEEIIKEQQRIDRAVFGKTNLNDDGNIIMSNNDVVGELEEIKAGINELTTLVDDIKGKLRNSEDTSNQDMSDELKELKQEMSEQTLYLGQVKEIIYGRITVLLIIIIVVSILILVKLY